MCFVVNCWEGVDLLALVCGVFCEFVTFPLVSWVRCGTCVTSLTVSHTGFTEHIIIKGNVVIVDSRSFGAMYGELYWTNNGE